MKVLTAIAIALFSAAFCFAQTEERIGPPSVEELYLAKDDGNGKAGEQVKAFNASDVPIHCVVLLDSPQKVTVKMNFVAVAVTGVRADTKVVTASYTTKEGQNRVNFTGRPEGKWTPGKYRVDVFVDGKMSRNVEFEILAPKAAPGDNTAIKNFVDQTRPRPKRSRP